MYNVHPGYCTVGFGGGESGKYDRGIPWPFFLEGKKHYQINSIVLTCNTLVSKGGKAGLIKCQR